MLRHLVQNTIETLRHNKQAYEADQARPNRNMHKW